MCWKRFKIMRSRSLDSMQMIEYFQLISIAQKRMTFSLGKYCRKASFHSEKKCNYRFLRNSLEWSKKKNSFDIYLPQTMCSTVWHRCEFYVCVCVWCSIPLAMYACHESWLCVNNIIFDFLISVAVVYANVVADVRFFRSIFLVVLVVPGMTSLVP